MRRTDAAVDPLRQNATDTDSATNHLGYGRETEADVIEPSDDPAMARAFGLEPSSGPTEKPAWETDYNGRQFRVDEKYGVQEFQGGSWYTVSGTDRDADVVGQMYRDLNPYSADDPSWATWQEDHDNPRFG